MGLFYRIRTVISSYINSLLNRAEDPEKMLDQAIIDMNNQMLESKKAVALAIADEKKLQREMDNYAQKSSDWERKAVLAVKAGDDELAKEALLRKQEADNTVFQYRQQWEMQHKSVEKLKVSLKELQDKINEAQRKKNLLIARAKRAEAQGKIQQTMSSVTSNKSAFEAFDRLEEKIRSMELQQEAFKELADIDEGLDLEKRFAALEKSDNSADILLEDLKAKIKELPEA